MRNTKICLDVAHMYLCFHKFDARTATHTNQHVIFCHLKTIVSFAGDKPILVLATASADKKVKLWAAPSHLSS